MRRLPTMMILASLLALPMAGQASADHSHAERVQGPACGSRFVNEDQCSFRYRGGQLYLDGSVSGSGLPTGLATIRLEAKSRVTGERRVLLSCTTPASGGCAAAGRYDTIEHLAKGQRLFCFVEGAGRGHYACGTLVKKRNP